MLQPSIYPGLTSAEILQLKKPAQYLGGELNSVVKETSSVEVRTVLAFPDLYEIGMSHLGLQILYSIVNSLPWAWAERVFMPLPDMEELLRQKQLALCTLESKTSLREFDIVGFSLQYELCGTNILTMLDLAKIPLRSVDRKAEDPIVIAGGPVAFYSEFLSPFFDLICVGDSETAIVDIETTVRSWKASSKQEGRIGLLKLLSELPGVHVPSQHKKGQTIQARKLTTLKDAPFVTKPIVPSIRTIHNRLAVEVMRGCVRSCRFCQAGFIYRPLRERPPLELSKNIEAALQNSGFEEISLLSLSTVDYCGIAQLLKHLMDTYTERDTISIALPSTRIDGLSVELLDQIKRVRKTAFTLAPEGGTQRMRDVINKQISEEQILSACATVLGLGWKGIKLYFMIGLPTETDEDVEGIVLLAEKIKRLPQAKGKTITVSVSTFVPKPHTPFQWAEQISRDETKRRQAILHEGLKRIRVNFRYHDSFLSVMEGVFSRAGSELAPLIERAYQLGCRLDAWDEYARPDLWEKAFAECAIDHSTYLRERNSEEALPWDHISCGVNKQFFLREWKRAFEAQPTPNCLGGKCAGCGVCDDDLDMVQFPNEAKLLNDIPQATNTISPDQKALPIQRIRLRFSKKGELAFLGHLELVDIIIRAARRAQLPLAFSQGFHPLPRIAFGPPLQLGIESDAEYADFYFTDTVDPETTKRSLAEALPPSLTLYEAFELPVYGKSIQEGIFSQRFKVISAKKPGGILESFLAQLQSDKSLLGRMTQAPEAITENHSINRIEKHADSHKKAKGSPTTFRLGDYLKECMVCYMPEDGALNLELELSYNHAKASPRLSEVLEALCNYSVGEFTATKTAARFNI